LHTLFLSLVLVLLKIHPSPRQASTLLSSTMARAASPPSCSAAALNATQALVRFAPPLLAKADLSNSFLGGGLTSTESLRDRTEEGISRGAFAVHAAPPPSSTSCRAFKRSRASRACEMCARVRHLVSFGGSLPPNGNGLLRHPPNLLYPKSIPLHPNPGTLVPCTLYPVLSTLPCILNPKP